MSELVIRYKHNNDNEQTKVIDIILDKTILDWKEFYINAVPSYTQAYYTIAYLVVLILDNDEVIKCIFKECSSNVENNIIVHTYT